MSSSRLLPPLKSLQAFRYAAKHLSFKVTAEKLFVTQAAVSQQIKTLEQTLGVDLFERQTRQVVLTSEGVYLFEYADRAFRLLEEGVKGITEDRNPNALVISSLPSFSNRWLVSRLGLFQSEFPDVHLRLSPSLGLSSFVDNDLDLCIRLGKGQYEGLQSDLLFEEYLLPVCHPSLINEGQSTKEFLESVQVITDEGSDMGHVRPAFEKFLNLYDAPLKSQLHVSDSTTLIEALLSRQGIAMARFSLIYELLEKGQLALFAPVFIKSAFDFYLVAPSTHFKYQKVIDFQYWIRKEVEVIDRCWQKYCKDNSELQEITF